VGMRVVVLDVIRRGGCSDRDKEVAAARVLQEDPGFHGLPGTPSYLL
jgi:hypothetical protein